MTSNTENETRIRVTKEGSKQLTLFRVRYGYKNLGVALEQAMKSILRNEQRDKDEYEQHNC